MAAHGVHPTDDGPAADGSSPDVEPLAHVVDRQRRENEHLHAAMRSRAVIEQAKGILVARTGGDPEAAFRRLVDYSQRSNRKVTNVAAEVVARTVTTPRPVGGARGEKDPLREPSTEDPATFLTAAAVISAPDLQELLQAVIQHGQRFGVTGGMLALAEPDGALRLVGYHGIEEHLISGWRRVPPGQELPLSAAAERREAIWLRTREEREDRFPDARRFPGHREACAVVPMELERQLVGVLSLDWDEPDDLPDATRDSITAVAELCAAPIAQLLRDYDDALPGLDFEPGYAGWFWGFLDSLPYPAIVLEPWVEGDAIADLRVIHANSEAREVTALSSGDSLLESFPHLAEMELLWRCSQVLRSGTPHREPVVAAPDSHGSCRSPVEELTIARVGTLLIACWRHRSS